MKKATMTLAGLALLLQAAILLRAGHPLARGYCRSRLGAGVVGAWQPVL